MPLYYYEDATEDWKTACIGRSVVEWFRVSSSFPAVGPDIHPRQATAVAMPRS